MQNFSVLWRKPKTSMGHQHDKFQKIFFFHQSLRMSWNVQKCNKIFSPLQKNQWGFDLPPLVNHLTDHAYLRTQLLIWYIQVCKISSRSDKFYGSYRDTDRQTDGRTRWVHKPWLWLKLGNCTGIFVKILMFVRTIRSDLFSPLRWIAVDVN